MKRLSVMMILMVISVMVSGCASTNYIKDDDAKRIYNIAYDDMFILVPQALEVAGMSVKEVNKDEGFVKGMASPSFWTSSLANIMMGGDEVNAEIRPIEDESSSVFVRVYAQGDLMDMGRSARVVRSFYGSLDEIVRQKLSAGATSE